MKNQNYRRNFLTILLAGIAFYPAFASADPPPQSPQQQSLATITTLIQRPGDWHKLNDQFIQIISGQPPASPPPCRASASVGGGSNQGNCPRTLSPGTGGPVVGGMPSPTPNAAD